MKNTFRVYSPDTLDGFIYPKNIKNKEKALCQPYSST